MTAALFTVAGVVARWTLFAAVLVAIGAAAFRFFVLGRIADGGTRASLLLLAEHAARFGSAAALAAQFAAFARLPIQLHDVYDPTAPFVPQYRALTDTTWSRVVVCQVVLAACATLLYERSRCGGRGVWAAAAVASALLALTPALSGHAIGSERLTVLAVVTDWVHVLAAGCWLGAMLVLLAAVAAPRTAGQERLPGALVAAFSTLALTAAAAVVLSGVVSSWLHLGAVADLWRSRYGRRLLVKLGAVALMMAGGAYNWRRAGPRLLKDNDVERIAGVIGLELLAGALVLFATALLVATPPPGED